MSEFIRNLRRQLKRLPRSKPINPYAKYRLDPVGYARDVLRVTWWAKQAQIAELILKPPHRVLVKACHSVGKSHVAAGLVNWWYDTRNPGVAMTTAPTARQVRDVLWKEIRKQRRERGGFPGPKMPRLESAPDHFAHGFTAGDAEAFQGQHEAAVLIVLDEAVGIDPPIWEAADSMVQGVEYGIVAFCNPTDASSELYRREQMGGWHIVHIEALEHPNIAAELAGQPPLYPSAVRLAWLEERLREWASPVNGEPQAGDIEFRPGSGTWLRPGPLAQARLLGRWPAAATGVWSDVLWSSIEKVERNIPLDRPPEIGCDVARFGDDDTAIHVRWGPVSLHHEWANGWSTTQTAGRLKQLAAEWASFANACRDSSSAPFKPEDIPIKVDDDGVGGGVVDQAGDFRFVPVNAGSEAYRDEDYPNRRSELWFDVAEGRAKPGQLSLLLLTPGGRAEVERGLREKGVALPLSPMLPDTLLKLKVQAMAPTYRLDAAGRRVVEPKDKTKDRLGRSPDDMDALNLAYCETAGVGGWEWVDTTPQQPAYGSEKVPDIFGR